MTAARVKTLSIILFSEGSKRCEEVSCCECIGIEGKRKGKNPKEKEEGEEGGCVLTDG